MRRGGADNRRDVRLPVRLAATLRIYRGRFDVILADLSNHGAMVTGGGAMPVQGDEVVLACEGLEVVATVAWTVGANAGLALHRAIDAAAIIHDLRARARPEGDEP